MASRGIDFPLADPSTDAHSRDMSCGEEARARRGRTDLSPGGALWKTTSASPTRRAWSV